MKQPNVTYMTPTEKYIEKRKLPKGFVFNHNVIIATTEDDYVFMCRLDLLEVMHKPEWHLEKL